MKIIKFYGVSNFEKQRLLLYVGKVLSVDHYVTLVTAGSFLQRTMSRIHYNDQFFITDGLDQAMIEPEYLLVDCDENSGRVENQEGQDGCLRALISGVSKSEVDKNEGVVSQLNDKSIIVLQGLMVDSQISEVYLKRRYKLSKKGRNLRTYYLSERDEAIHLDNDYSELLSIRGFGKSYLSLMAFLVKQISLAPDKVVRSWMKKAVRRV